MTDPRFQDLTELSRRMTSSLDLRTLTEDLVSWAIRETGAATAAITLWDQERNVLMALTHLEIADLGLKVASGEVYAELDKYPATRRVLERRQALSVEVGHPTENLGEQKWLRERGLTAAMVLPLISSGQAIGTMEIARANGAFSPDDVAYCQLLCDMAGSAVQNATLHGELESTLAQYRSLIERLPAITYVDDLETGASEFVSPQIEELFGITQEKWLSSPDAWLTTVHPDDRERARKGYVAATKARQPFRDEYRVVYRSPSSRSTARSFKGCRSSTPRECS